MRTLSTASAFLALLACLAVAACDSADPALEAEVYAGHFSQGFEDSDFRPCNLDAENWRLEGNDAGVSADLTTAIGAAFEAGGTNPLFMRLRGTPSEPGEYPGIFITYDRTFAIDEVIEVRELRAGDCG